MRVLHDNNFVKQLGRLADAPTIKTGSDYTVANFRLCVTHLKQSDESTDDAKKYEVAEEYWINVEAWGRVADQAKKLKKGQVVEVQGELKPEDEWTDDDGVKHRGGLRVRAQKILLDPADISEFELRPRRGAQEAPATA